MSRSTPQIAKFTFFITFFINIKIKWNEIFNMAMNLGEKIISNSNVCVKKLINTKTFSPFKK